MKTDKTGACTVLSAIVTAARLAPGIPLLAVAPAVENMPGPGATRPGDVVRAMNGKAVDITNTDAEGRLILGDAMTYAEQLGATHVVDVATLTGAVARALGHLVTGAFGDPQAWYDEVAASARQAGERFWQLPLVEEDTAGDGEHDRRHGELQLTRGRPDQERPLPAPVRDGAVGPPRHRRVGVLPKAHRLGAPRRDRSRHGDAGRARPGGRSLTGPTPGGRARGRRFPGPARPGSWR